MGIIIAIALGFCCVFKFLIVTAFYAGSLSTFINNIVQYYYFKFYFPFITIWESCGRMGYKGIQLQIGFRATTEQLK